MFLLANPVYDSGVTGDVSNGSCARHDTTTVWTLRLCTVVGAQEDVTVVVWNPVKSPEIRAELVAIDPRSSLVPEPMSH